MYTYETVIDYHGIPASLILTLSYDHVSDEYEISDVTLNDKRVSDDKMIEILGHDGWKRVQENAIDDARWDAEGDDSLYDESREIIY